MEPGRSVAVDSVRLRAVIDRIVAPLIVGHDVPGMAVGVTIDGQSFVVNYGVASRDGDVPVTAETLFEIGSVSKTFTAALAAYAHALGRLSWDDSPGRFLPSLQGSPIDRVRLVHLGTYTAGGLPLQFAADVHDDEQMVRFFREWRPEAAPGTQRRYSNPSIGLLGHVTGRALDAGFTQAMQEQLLPRLGLEHTFVTVPPYEMHRYAWGYTPTDQPVRVSAGMFDAEAYGIRTTAADLIRFVELNIDPGRLEESVRRAVEATHVAHFRVGDMVQGLGWEQYPWPVPVEQLLAGNSRTMIMDAQPAARLTPPQAPSTPTLFNKTGSTNGFGAYVAFVPDARIGVVLLANRNVPIPDRVRAAHAILEQLSSRE